MTRRTPSILVLATTVAGCAAHHRTHNPTVVFKDDSDIATLGRLWRGETKACLPPAAAGGTAANGARQVQSCSASGWESVTVREGPKGRELHATTTDPYRCDLPRFAGDDPKALDDMEGQIVSTSTMLPDDHLFPKACLTVSRYYDRALCEVFLSARQVPSNQPSASPGARAGCP